MRTPQPRAAAALIAILVAGGGCKNDSPTTPSANTLHATSTDPAGDAAAVIGVPVAPDLVRSAIDVTSGLITLTIQFAPGSMDAQTTRVTVEFDSDQDAATGNAVAGPLGVDYSLDLWRGQATIMRATPSTCASSGQCYTNVGAATLSLGTDTMTTTLELGAIGNANGRLNYRVGTYVSPSPVAPTPIADWMPDISFSPAHVP